MFLRKLAAYTILGIAVMFFLTFQANTNKAFQSFLKKSFPKIEHSLVLSELTLSGFESVESFKQMAIAKMSYHKFKTLFFTLFLIYGIYKLSLRISKKGDRDKIYKILDGLNLIYRETDKEGKVTLEEVPTVSFDKENHVVLVKNLHERNVRKAIEYSQGLITDLKSIGMIEHDEGVAETTGRPGEVKIQIMTSDLMAKSSLNSFLKSIGLYAESEVGGKKVPRFPIITEDGNDLVIDGNGVPLQIHKIKFNLNQIGITFNKELSQVISIGKNSFKLLSKNDAPVLYSAKQRVADIKEIISNKLSEGDGKGITEAEAEQIYLEAGKYGWISDNYQPFKTNIIDVLRKRFENTKEISWYFGALRDSLFKLPSNEIMESTEVASHIVVIGTSGSGKSEFLKTMCTSLHHAYEDNVEIYYANGTASPDFDILTKRYSPMGLESAKPDESAKEVDQLNALNTILRYAQQQANKRADLFKSMAKDLDVACAKVSDYRKLVAKLHSDPEASQEMKIKYPLKMTDIFIVIDEFAGISARINYNEKWDNEGTPARYIHRMCAENRKYGIRMVIATQECRADSIPSRLLSNIHATIIMKVKEKDMEYMIGRGYSFVGNPLEYERGSGMISAPGIIQCQTSGSQLIPIMSYYLGANAMEVYKCSPYIFPPEKKMEYDLEMLSLSEKDRDFTKVANATLQKVVKQAFFEREGWKITFEQTPDNFLINTYAEKTFGESLVKLKVVYAKIEDIIMDNFFDRIEREETSKVDTTVYFILGKPDPKKISDISEKLIKHSPCIILSSNEYSMELSKAYDYLSANNNTPVFDSLFTQIEQQKQLRIETILKDTYKDVNTKKHKICLNKLKEIIENPNAEEKGRLFEDFILLIERSLNFDTVKGIELSLENHVDFKFSKNNRNEGGLDLFRWTNRAEKRGIGFQLKNQPSKALTTEIVDKIGKTIKLYTSLGITFEKFVLISTGPITEQAKKEALACGYYVYGYSDLEMYFAAEIVGSESFFTTLQNDKNVDISNNLFTKEEMEEIYHSSNTEKENRRKKVIESSPDHQEVLTTFKNLIEQKRNNKDSAKINLKKIDSNINVSELKNINEEDSAEESSAEDDSTLFEDIVFESDKKDSKTLKKASGTKILENESSDKPMSFDLVQDIKYKVQRGYLNWTPIAEWEFYKKLPSMAERKTLSRAFDYIKIEDQGSVSVFIVKNERTSRKYGVEILKAITAAQKVFKTRKIKITKIEIHYVGDIDKVAIGQKVRFVQY